MRCCPVAARIFLAKILELLQGVEQDMSYYVMQKLNKNLAGYLFVICLMLVIPSYAYASEKMMIRVCLDQGINQVDFRVFRGNYQLIDGATGLIVAQPEENELWSIVKQGPVMRIRREGKAISHPYAGPILLLPNEAEDLALFRYRNIRYRNALSVSNEQEGLLAVTLQDLEHYLYGVVGKEIGVNAGFEALKAQAVASRSYALSLVGSSTRFDVGTDVSTQVFGGYEAELLPGSANVIKAVNETAGKVLYFNNQLVRAFFHANAGGFTENSENVWTAAVPYLQGVESPEDIWAFQYPVQVNGWPGDTFQWKKTFTRLELEDQIKSWNGKAVNTGRLDNVINVGSIQDLVATRFSRDGVSETVSGRVTQLDFVGSKGIKSFFRDNIRQVLGLKSTLFEVEMDSQVAIRGVDGLVSVNTGNSLIAAGAGGFCASVNGVNPNYFLLGNGTKKQVPKNFSVITFVGRGHGHGVGMSQWGARGMAEKGYNYEEILQHYYNPGKVEGLLAIESYKFQESTN